MFEHTDRTVEQEFSSIEFACLDEIEKKPHWDLITVAVVKSHQRRGIGAAIVSEGQKVAREEGLPVTVHSGPDAFKLYSKLGFEEMERKAVFEGIGDDIVMVWDPSHGQG